MGSCHFASPERCFLPPGVYRYAGGLIGLGGAEFRLPSPIGAVPGFPALEAAISTRQ